MGLDKQRIAAVRTLERLGYTYRGEEWLPPVTAPPLPLTAEADAMHGMLMRRAVALAGCTKGSDEEGELPHRGSAGVDIAARIGLRVCGMVEDEPPCPVQYHPAHARQVDV